MAVGFRLFARFFAEGENWAAMLPATRKEYLRTYLFRLWSTDRRGQQLLPEPERRVPSRAKWGSFYISDAELEDLCDEVMRMYHVQEHHVA